MPQKTRFSLSRLELNGIHPDDVVDTLEKTTYDDSTGIGILNVLYDQSTVDVLLVKRISTYINQFDFPNRAYQKQQIDFYNQSKFTLDFSTNLLYCQGSKSNFPIVKSFLKNCFSQNVRLAPVELRPYNVFKELKKKKVQFTVEDITIERFNFNNGAIGRFTAQIINNKVIKELFTEYENDLTKIVISVKREDNNFRAHLYNNAVIGIIGNDEDSNIESFNFLKTIIF